MIIAIPSGLRWRCEIFGTMRPPGIGTREHVTCGQADRGPFCFRMLPPYAEEFSGLADVVQAVEMT